MKKNFLKKKIQIYLIILFSKNRSEVLREIQEGIEYKSIANLKIIAHNEFLQFFFFNPVKENKFQNYEKII